MEDTLGLIAVQHELGMAIGLDIRLKPMLRGFTQVCLKRLGLAGINVYFDTRVTTFYADNNEHQTHMAEVFSIPDTHLVAIPNIEQVFDDLKLHPWPWLETRCEASAKTIYFFALDKIGLIALTRKQAPLSPVYLELLSPIFKRLAISCQASIEHEQLLAAIEAKRAAESTIVFQLYHDELTRLPNRRSLMEALANELQFAQKQQLQGALLFIDLDRFKAINDTLGHSVGDELLKAVADILQQAVRNEDHVARLSGDEFVIVLTKIKPGEDEVAKVVNIVLDKIREAFAKSIKAGEHLLHISPSIGVELFPLNHTGPDRILRNADTAMYLAKQQGQFAAVFYRAHMSADLEVRLEVEKQMQQAIKTCEQFSLLYQPQYNINGACIGAEALMRWQGEDGRFISPGHFIPVAEETGLMLELGKWVIRTACAHIYELEQTGIPKEFQKVSVNVSAIQFNQPEFVNELLTEINASGITPSLFGIELTESALINNVTATRDKIALLKGQGIEVSVDDFGTGYSSLSYLNRFPIKTLKIDQAFVRNANVDSGNRAIVETIIALGKSLNLNVIAEGVETYEELACLQQLQCFQYQGFYFSQPLKFSDFQQLLLTQLPLHCEKIRVNELLRRHTDQRNG